MPLAGNVPWGVLVGAASIVAKPLAAPDRRKKTRSWEAGFGKRDAKRAYFSASNTRVRISSTVPRPEIARYAGAFRPFGAVPCFAQSL